MSHAIQIIQHFDSFVNANHVIAYMMDKYQIDNPETLRYFSNSTFKLEIKLFKEEARKNN
jgi:hypothetical protein